MFPQPTAEQIWTAMQHFDDQMRGKSDWQGWESNRAHYYAIEANAKQYPVKQLVSLATGQPVSSFSGGNRLNNAVRALGFTVSSIGPPTPASDAGLAAMTAFRVAVTNILSGYRDAATTAKFSGEHPVVKTFTDAKQAMMAFPAVSARKLKVVASAGQGNWASVPWFSILDPEETNTTQKGVYAVYLFRGDMKGVYATLNQGVTELSKIPSKDKRVELERRAGVVRSAIPHFADTDYALDNKIELASATPLGAAYEPSTIAHKFYPADAVPEPQELADDLTTLLDAYRLYIDAKGKSPAVEPPMPPPEPDFSLVDAFKTLQATIASTGFVFEPWQLAAYVTALRTKPFVILAGVSGTGKSQLPKRVAEATGSQFERVPVRPDWTDSSDVLGYVDLQSKFRPGGVLRFAKAARELPNHHHVCLLDEMNLARVEQYFAEMLSGIEDRAPDAFGGFSAPQLLGQSLAVDDGDWMTVGWSANLAIVGTVNMDESTHGFSRKVLDRAFTLEMSDVDLSLWEASAAAATAPEPWPASAWFPRALRLSDLRGLQADERKAVEDVIAKLIELNAILTQAQVQVGYRVRDEVALFVLHARDIAAAFTTASGQTVEPLDLALHMKILPRLAGGSATMRRVIVQLLGWAVDGRASDDEAAMQVHVDKWAKAGRPASIAGARFGRTAARLALMWERLQHEGFTSYWL
jgi:hypothetical protein